MQAIIVELTDRCSEEKKVNPYLFELLYQALNYINEGYDPEIIKNIYEMKMLPSLGMYPVLNQCVICGATEGTVFFFNQGGRNYLPRCLEKDPYHLKVSPATIKLLRIFYYLDLNRLGNISVKPETKAELKKVIDGYYDEYSGLYLKSKKFLEQIEKLGKDLIMHC